MEGEADCWKIIYEESSPSMLEVGGWGGDCLSMLKITTEMANREKCSCCCVFPEILTTLYGLRTGQWMWEEINNECKTHRLHCSKATKPEHLFICRRGGWAIQLIYVGQMLTSGSQKGRREVICWITQVHMFSLFKGFITVKLYTFFVNKVHQNIRKYIDLKVILWLIP